MMLSLSRLSAFRNRVGKGRFSSRRMIGFLVAAISVGAMLFSGASAVKSASWQVYLPPLAAPGTNQEAPPQPGVGQPELSWRNLAPLIIPVSPGTWTPRRAWPDSQRAGGSRAEQW